MMDWGGQGGWRGAGKASRREMAETWTRVLAQEMEFGSESLFLSQPLSPRSKESLDLGVLLWPLSISSLPKGLRHVEFGGWGDVPFVLRQTCVVCRGPDRPGFKYRSYYLLWDLEQVR